MQLTIGQLERFLGIELIAGRLTGLALQRSRHAFAPASELDVALVGEHDGLRTAASTDDHRLGIRASLPEPFQQRR